MIDVYNTSRINFLCHLKGVRIGQINVGRRDSQHQTAGLLDIGQNHASNLLLDIKGLVAHRHFGQTGQINEGQIQNYNNEINQRKKNQKINKQNAIQINK